MCLIIDHQLKLDEMSYYDDDIEFISTTYNSEGPCKSSKINKGAGFASLSSGIGNWSGDYCSTSMLNLIDPRFLILDISFLTYSGFSRCRVKKMIWNSWFIFFQPWTEWPKSWYLLYVRPIRCSIFPRDAFSMHCWLE